MPEQNEDDLRDEERDEDETEGDESEEVDETEDESDEEEDEETPAGRDKQIQDLQSAKDKETARANKAEKALRELQAAGGRKGGPKLDPATQAILEDLRDASLDAVVAEYPELREYELDRSLIEGATRAEMRESAASLADLVKKVASRARNKALVEAGVNPEPVGSRRSKPRDFNRMSDEEFLKFIDNN